MNRTDLEIKALLESSGEADLADEERKQTSVWRRDLESLSRMARHHLGATRPPQARGTLLRAAKHNLALRRRWRWSMRLAAAASLTLLAWNFRNAQPAQPPDVRLQRLDNVLALLEYGNGDTAGRGKDLSGLSERLIRLQAFTRYDQEAF